MIDDEVYEQMGRDYTKHLAQAMGNTRMQIINNLFEDEYVKWSARQLHLVYIKRGRYEIYQNHKRVAKNIKHRREALALMKLLKENDNGTA
jgi:hypothetical protein